MRSLVVLLFGSRAVFATLVYSAFSRVGRAIDHLDNTQIKK